VRVRRFLLSASLIVAFSGCSDSPDGTNPGNNTIVPPNGTNVVGIIVDAGPKGSNGSPVGYVNGVFVTVTVCVPGTASCKDIDHVLVDTGSSGLRLLANDGTAGGELSLPLPQQKDGSGVPLAECAQFLDGFTWGPIALADMRIAGEKANGIPIQVIGESTYSVPSSCESVGVDESTLEGNSGLFVNGILGVGLFLQDCGPACEDPGAGNPGLYYACSSATTCNVAAVPTSSQVVNPVSMFPVDRNGVILELPTVPAAGAPAVNGSLVFGIGTQPNNGLGNATVFPVDSGGTLVTTFPLNGSSYSGSFIDSGSNGFFFLNGATAGIAECSSSSGLQGFYCPSGPLDLSAQNKGTAGIPTAQVNFSVANAATLLASDNSAFGNLGGPNGGSTPDQQLRQSFDWGLSFFFGRNVFTAIEGASTPHGVGPWFAY
jgi:hypothetical protein